VRILLVAAFGAAGALSRYALDTSIPNPGDGRFPLATLLINVAGSFALGVLVALVAERMVLSEEWRIALGVGFLSAFTTFSTLSVDTVRLAEGSHMGLAALNVAASLVLGLAAAYAGLSFGRAL